MTFSTVHQELANDLPELVLAIRRNGTIVAHFGGNQVAALVPDEDDQGKALDDVWPAAVAQSVKQLCRKAMVARLRVDTIIDFEGVQYEVQATATAPDRATCIIRRVDLANDVPCSESATAEPAVYLDRRRFLPLIHDAVASAALKETCAAMIVIELAGLSELSEIDSHLADHVLSCVLLRLRESPLAPAATSTQVVTISEFHLGMVIGSNDRKVIEAMLSQIQENVQRPVCHKQDQWHVSCYAGVALLGRDSNTPRELMDQARIACAEARRAGASRPQFFSDTMKLKSVARLDVARELLHAIRVHEIGMRYLGRYELSSGRLDALVGYVTWHHPMRGAVPPKEFLKVAEVTGAAVALSREMLRLLGEDVRRSQAQTDKSVCFSYGPLRHHLLHENFVRNIEEFLDQASLPPQRLEIRVAERSFVAMPTRIFTELQRIGVRAVVDEVGRSMSSLAKLAASPLWGIQLDRKLVEDIHARGAALRLCKAGIGAADALGLASIATGVDNEPTRRLLVENGCRFGCGDVFASGELAINRSDQGAATA